MSHIYSIWLLIQNGLLKMSLKEKHLEISLLWLYLILLCSFTLSLHLAGLQGKILMCLELLCTCKEEPFLNCSWKRFCIESKLSLSFAGVILVMISVGASIGNWIWLPCNLNYLHIETLLLYRFIWVLPSSSHIDHIWNLTFSGTGCGCWQHFHHGGRVSKIFQIGAWAWLSTFG